MNVTLHDILTEDFIHRFQESFALSTGFGTVFVDLQGKHIGPGSNFSKLCQEINKSEEGAAYCTKTNRQAIDIALKSGRPSIYICHAGLVNIEIPLTFEGEYIGAITAGQVRCSDFHCFPRDQAGDEFPWLKTKEAVSFLMSIKTLTKEEILATAVSLENLANYIVQSVMYNKLQERLAEEQRLKLESEKKQIEMEHTLKLAELDALQKQVTPHFMFNVLNSVSRLISLDESEKAKSMLDSFSLMLRYSLHDSTYTVTLADELEYIKNYLLIQRTRFVDRVHYEIRMEEPIKDLIIPYFALQPLVENAIEHGILPKEEGGNLLIRCWKDKVGVNLEISDDGIGINESELNGLNQRFHEGHLNRCSEQVGLRNSFQRFRHLFGERMTYAISSQPDKGTTVSIRILL